MEIYNVENFIKNFPINTVLTIDEFKFVADNTDSLDSTRIKRSLSPFETKENNLQELEELLTK